MSSSGGEDWLGLVNAGIVTFLFYRCDSVMVGIMAVLHSEG